MPPDSSEGYFAAASSGKPDNITLNRAISSSNAGVISGKNSFSGTSIFSATLSVENKAPP